MGMAQTPW